MEWKSLKKIERGPSKDYSYKIPQGNLEEILFKVIC